MVLREATECSQACLNQCATNRTNLPVGDHRDRPWTGPIEGKGTSLHIALWAWSFPRTEAATGHSSSFHCNFEKMRNRIGLVFGFEFQPLRLGFRFDGSLFGSFIRILIGLCHIWGRSSRASSGTSFGSSASDSSDPVSSDSTGNRLIRRGRRYFSIGSFIIRQIYHSLPRIKEKGNFFLQSSSRGFLPKSSFLSGRYRSWFSGRQTKEAEH